jgi:hypothetical protein
VADTDQRGPPCGSRQQLRAGSRAARASCGSPAGQGRRRSPSARDVRVSAPRAALRGSEVVAPTPVVRFGPGGARQVRPRAPSRTPIHDARPGSYLGGLPTGERGGVRERAQTTQHNFKSNINISRGGLVEDRLRSKGGGGGWSPIRAGSGGRAAI